ncbi:MAG TPA: hypothetical protein VN203_10035 [Candidatus Acidoferrum sp.]|nr:hypothetical protein [Candidatus Methylomirabilis sp.]HWU37972.1 hypothetical protein [Candidatus Acidoferrum sp.]
MKTRVGVVLVGVMLLLGSAVPAIAMVHGGFHRGFHGGFHHHVFVHSGVFIGVPFVFGNPFWWGPWPAYPAPPVVVQSSPPTYIQQAPAPPAYWYYCQNPQGYYPAVPQCPGGWMTVVPQPPAP